MRIEAILMATFAHMSRPPAKWPMGTACIHEGTRMGNYAKGRGIFANVAMGIASIRIGSTQHWDTLIVEFSLGTPLRGLRT